jgi:hypothetical protein
MGALMVLLVALWPAGASAQKRPAPPDEDLLTKARISYNMRDFDGAIASATKARSMTGTAEAADLVLARARLERYRATSDRTDLVAARETLVKIQPERLALQDRIELLVGFGEALYLDGLYGAAAELFESALPRSQPGRSLPAATTLERGRVLDWWATALDREAQGRYAADRGVLYARIVGVMEEELSRDPASATAAYWLAAANRAIGDLDRAWDAAIAGWVRGALAGEKGARLREDLDRLVLQAIIPERVRLLADNDQDRARIAADMEAEWEGIKKDWKRPAQSR